MTRFSIPALAALAPLALLAACGKDEPAVESSEQGGKAAGEVLGGTISDSMIALDQLTSQSPPAAASGGSAGGGSNGSSSTPDSQPADQGDGAEPAPSADPAPDDNASPED